MTSSQQRRALRFPVESINRENEAIRKIVIRLLVEAGLAEKEARFRVNAVGKELRAPLGNVVVACMTPKLPEQDGEK